MAHGRNGRGVLGLGAHVAMIDGFGALATLPQVPAAMRGGQQISAKRLLRANVLAVREAQSGRGRPVSTEQIALNRPVTFRPPGRSEQQGPLARRLAMESKTSVARLRYGRPAPGGSVTVSALQRQQWARFGNWPGKFFGTQWPSNGLGAHTVGGETYEYAKSLDDLGRDPGPPTRVPPGAPPEGRWMKDLSLARAEFAAFRIWRFATQAQKDFGEQVDRYTEQTSGRAAVWSIDEVNRKRRRAWKLRDDLDAVVASLIGKQKYILKKTKALYAMGYGPQDPATDYIAGAIKAAFDEQLKLAGLWNEAVQELYGYATEEAKRTTAMMDSLGLAYLAQWLSDVAELPRKLLTAAQNIAAGVGRSLDMFGWIAKWGLPVALLGVGGFVVYRYARRGKRLVEAVT